MNPDIQVIDNFVPPNALKELTDFFTYNCDWRWQDSCVYPLHLEEVREKFRQKDYDYEGTLTCAPLDDYQLVHMIYTNWTYVSPLKITPFFEELGAHAIVRCKANLNPRTSEIVKHSFHRDFPFDCKTAVFYLNTCDGYTEFEECGTRVESVAGRVAIFPSHLHHTGTSTTNDKKRIVINTNYF